MTLVGTYVTTHDVYDTALCLDDLWESDPERAISLEVVRCIHYEEHSSHLI